MQLRLLKLLRNDCAARVDVCLWQSYESVRMKSKIVVVVLGEVGRGTGC
jgi:hypothetical protein